MMQNNDGTFQRPAEVTWIKELSEMATYFKAHGEMELYSSAKETVTKLLDCVLWRTQHLMDDAIMDDATMERYKK